MANAFNPVANQINRPYEHPAYKEPFQRLNPNDAFNNTSESWAHGIYNAPGNLVQGLQAIGEYTQGGDRYPQARQSVDKAIGTDVLNSGYSPESGYQKLISLAGEAAADPAQLLGAPYVAMKSLKYIPKIGDELIASMMRSKMRSIDGAIGYHGSPHKFDKFDAGKVGTGEGAQAYGHGAAYIAEVPEVGGQYRNVNTEMLIDGRPFSVDSHQGFDGLDSLSVLALRARNGNVDEAIKYAETIDPDIAKQLREFDRSRLTVDQGNLYKVEVPDEKIAQMLDWDAPLSEQPENVQKALKSVSKDWGVDYEKRVMANWTGGDFYKNVGDDTGKVISEDLKSAGIPGIKYLDGNSRGAGEGTRNWIPFDENDITILERNGQPIPSLSKKPAGLPIDESKYWYRGGDSVKKNGVTFFVDDKNTAMNWAGGDASKLHQAKINPKNTYDFDVDPLNLQDKYKMAGPGEAGWSMDGPVNDLKKNGYDSYTWQEYSMNEPVERNIAVFDNQSILPTDTPSRMARARDMGMENDLYHGTKATDDFESFKVDDNEYMLDRALGVHLAKDPKISNTFVMDEVNGNITGAKEGGRVIPVKTLSDEKFLNATQNKYDWAKGREDFKPWQGIDSDQMTINNMIMEEAYKKDPSILSRYLVEARHIPEDEAQQIAESLASGKKTIVRDNEYSLKSFIDDFGGKPYNDADKALSVKLARESWQEQGYTGIKYLNTAPMETANATNAESYIVFDPKNIRSKFAQFDPSKKNSANLLAGGAAGAVGLNYINRGER